MKRSGLEHLIRAASAVTGQPDIVVIGSQALLSQFPDPLAELVRSMAADVFPLGRPDLSVLADGAVGERSMFHKPFGYYAHGVDEFTVTLPGGRKERLIPSAIPAPAGPPAGAWKGMTWRRPSFAPVGTRNPEFVKALWAHGMIDLRALHGRALGPPVDPDVHGTLMERLRWLTS